MATIKVKRKYLIKGTTVFSVRPHRVSALINVAAVAVAADGQQFTFFLCSSSSLVFFFVVFVVGFLSHCSCDADERLCCCCFFGSFLRHSQPKAMPCRETNGMLASLQQ